MAGIKFAKITLAMCLFSHIAYGEDLGSLKTELLNLKMQVRPLSCRQMAAAGGGGTIGWSNASLQNTERSKSDKLFPVAAEGVDLKSAFMFAPVTANAATCVGKTADADKVLCCMQVVYGRIKWVVLHVGRMLCSTGKNGKSNVCRDIRVRSNSASCAYGMLSADEVFTEKLDDGGQAQMLTTVWRF